MELSRALGANLLGVALLASGTPAVPPCSGTVAGDRDARQLLEGIRTLGKAGIPGRVCVFGEDAFPVLLGDVGGDLKAPIVAAGSAGAARLVAFSHNGYFGPALDKPDGWRLLENALRWAARKPRARVRVGSLDGDGLVQALAKRGFDVEVVDQLDRLERSPAIDVLCGGLKDWGADDVARIERWLKSGGAIVGGVTGWGWLQLNPGKDLARDCAANRLAAPFGIAWTDGTVAAGAEDVFHAEDDALAWTHALRAADALLGKQPPAGFGQREMEQASWTISQALRAVPEDERTFRARVQRGLAGVPATVPSESEPLKRERARERMQLALEADEGLRAPALRVRAHAAAASFPGGVPEAARRVVRDIAVDLGVPRWHSTGLYAAPGETVEVSIPAAATAKGLRLRIGAHKDDIAHHDAWKRAPRITREEALDTESVRVASPFGGLVYVVCPDQAPPEIVPVKLRNVVEAPRFVLGSTDPAAWRAKVRELPAPWAELETPSIVLTVPSSVVRTIDDPTAVLELWERALRAAADLAGLPLERASPERFVCDVQIGGGYMHSGYPIMAHLDAAAFITDPLKLCEHGWGPFHEVGHNHQSGAWTFEGTGEVTNNVFTLFQYEAVCGRKPADDERFADAARTRRWREQQDRQDAFERWKSDPFLALLVYVDVQQGFGWDVYKRVFREYRALKATELPGNDAAERDEWLVRISRACGRDLGPLFTSWGVPTSPEARSSLSDLVVWLPEGRL